MESQKLSKNHLLILKLFVFYQLHARGMKLGLYLEAGNTTKNGYPGSLNHMQTDVQTLVGWGVDMVTLDAYNVQDTGSLDQGTYSIHCNENIIILVKFSPLVALQVVKI